MLCKQLTDDVLKKLPAHLTSVILGMGCFWGVERLLWQQKGVWGTAVGYAGGDVDNPTYQQVCSGDTGHAEVVLVVYDPMMIDFNDLLTLFWENHDPTQGMRQGNDVGSQYRSVIYCTCDEQLQASLLSKQQYQQQLTLKGYTAITTEIKFAPVFYFAEAYHQRYLDKNPNGYCGLKGTGVNCVHQ
ncbi:peptide-methionine (S)-S-oxide reductase MsrA [Entomomonas moraniae]|uniref:Peptide methionine sulfoxide reductase MsrA n=1 Tax=Entomomonas moraniae TaxID=2213226 RepID=A0A3S9XEM6_9GAMM|nr:peptide-methionine (S)-S-oxide reductase MsrA [Entomomonas moraniae]AZS50894.1 peptide-methionine (S)-S-oxide reductase MsrA [Entomomonas moraniae]